MVAKDTSKIKSIAQKITMVPSVGICFDPIAQWQRQYERELRSSLDEVPPVGLEPTLEGF